MLNVVLATTINPLWLSQILMSADGGATWGSSIKGQAVSSVNQVRTKNTNTVANPTMPEHSERIIINMVDGSHISFDVKDVLNQPTWNVGGVAGLAAAHADITTWPS